MFDKLGEVIWHRVAVVRYQHAVLFSAAPKHFGVGNAGMQAEFRRALKIDGGLKALG